MEKNKKRESEIVQWSYDLVQNAYLVKPDDADNHHDIYLNYLFPFCNNYYGPTNPLVIFGGHSVKDLPERPYITVRDGIVPLCILFRDIKPSAIKGHLFIHRDLWFTVPEDWREKVKFFDVEATTVYDSKNLPKRIFIAGTLNSTLADPEEFEGLVKNLCDGLGKENIKNIDIMAFFPNKRTDLWGAWEEENVLNYSRAIFEHLKVEIKTPEWPVIHSENNFKDCLYYEVNAGTLVKDSYLSHFTLSRGAGLLRRTPDPIDAHFRLTSTVGLSLYHRMNLYEIDYEKVTLYCDPLMGDNFRYYKKLIEAANHKKKFNFKWEKWLATYLKRFFKESRHGALE